MSRRKIEKRNIRKLFKKSGSLCLTVPAEMAHTLKFREGQKVEFSLRGKTILLKDWEK